MSESVQFFVTLAMGFVMGTILVELVAMVIR